MVGELVGSGGVSSAFTKNLWFHFGPRVDARKSVSHGVEQPHSLTRSSSPSFCAAWRITSASGGVKFSTTAPSHSAALTRLTAAKVASLLGTVSVRSQI